jgi:hypothetical protein
MHINQTQGRTQGIPKPRKNARMSRSTSGIGKVRRYYLDEIGCFKVNLDVFRILQTYNLQSPNNHRVLQEHHAFPVWRW